MAHDQTLGSAASRSRKASNRLLDGTNGEKPDTTHLALIQETRRTTFSPSREQCTQMCTRKLNDWSLRIAGLSGIDSADPHMNQLLVRHLNTGTVCWETEMMLRGSGAPSNIVQNFFVEFRAECHFRTYKSNAKLVVTKILSWCLEL
ncbi:hypothetical protein B0H10DRAFT_2203031 [Mycena sp. CBHHK59/15]|nr:hypothetical protein B0H10DRAFT_2203031 [Mycena sp. CBHHK59/15]